MQEMKICVLEKSWSWVADITFSGSANASCKSVLFSNFGNYLSKQFDEVVSEYLKFLFFNKKISIEKYLTLRKNVKDKSIWCNCTPYP